jgi:sugar transferase (PEP-CTERM/EpsH1 system associated)
LRILALVSRPLARPLIGETLRLFHVLAGLARNHRVFLLYFQRDKHARVEVAELPSDLHNVRPVPFNRKWATFKAILSMLTSRAMQVSFLSSRAMRKAVREACRTFEPEILFVHMARMAQYAKEAEDVPTVLDLVDSFSLHLGSYAGLGAMRSRFLMRLETKKMARYECDCATKASLSLAASERDVEAVRNSPYFKGGRVEVLPNGVDTEYFAPKETEKDNSIVFVGNLAYPPNEDGILWFARKVFPKILKSSPSAKLVIVGMNPSVRVLSLARHEQIEVTGTVPDVRPYLWRAAVSVAPLRKAGGSQYKVLEAMACGRPLVITSAAAAGIDAVPGRDFEVADDPDDFAAKVSSLLESPDRRRRIAAAGRAVTEQKYTWNRIAANLEKMIESL